MSEGLINAKLYEFIVKVVEDKVKDIRVTREEFDKLVAAVNKLAEAQARTEERLNELAIIVEKLAVAIGELRREVGRLSETIGFSLEDIARVVLPGWLYRHLSVEVEELERKFLTIDGKEIEVNLYGEGLRKGMRVIIVGEAKSRIYGRDVNRFYSEIYKPIADKSKTKAIGILFGYLIHPSAKQRAEKLGLYTVASYQR